MKKLIYILIMSLVIASCGNKRINGNDTEYDASQVVESYVCVYGFASTTELPHIKQIIYKDSTLRYMDIEWKDSVVDIIAENFVPIYNKDFYEVINKDTTYTDIVWYDIDHLRFFFNNTTREIVLIIQYLNYNGSDEVYNDIIDDEEISFICSEMKTIDEVYDYVNMK